MAYEAVYGAWLGLLGPYGVGGAGCIAGGDWKSVFWNFGSKKYVCQGSQECP